MTMRPDHRSDEFPLATRTPVTVVMTVIARAVATVFLSWHKCWVMGWGVSVARVRVAGPIVIVVGVHSRWRPWWRGWPPRECSACWIASVTSWDACSFSNR